MKPQPTLSTKLANLIRKMWDEYCRQQLRALPYSHKMEDKDNV